MKRVQVWEVTRQVLLETENLSIMFGDETLAHLVAARLGWPAEGPSTTRRLLRALAQRPGDLRKGLTTLRNRDVLIFDLPETDYNDLLEKLEARKRPFAIPKSTPTQTRISA